jgi:hypothetical protein
VRTRAWYAEAQALPTPLFIVGEPRSGTTILYRSIQAHPEFTPHPGVDLTESQAMALLPGLLRRRDDDPFRLAAYLHSVEALAAVAADIEPLSRRRLAVRRLAGRRATLLKPWLASGEHHVVRRYFIEAARRRGARRLADKSPDHLAWVRHLGVALPTAQFVVVVRHRVDVYSSYLRRYSIDPEHSAWAKMAPDAFARRWESSVRLAMSLAASSSRLLLVRYEDLTTDPEPVIRRVLTHAGVDFDPACLLGADPHRHSPIDPYLFEPITPRTKDWVDYLQPGTAQALQHSLAAAMAEVGYAERSSAD